jgi:hypothetical protein
MGKAFRISMIRIWNYSKSSTYANRGVREVMISLDGLDVYFIL